jgi:hypothetical protein
LIVFSCFNNVEDDYDFDGNDFDWDVTVSLQYGFFQSGAEDSIALFIETDEKEFTSSHHIVNEVNVIEDNIFIELTGFYVSQAMHCDEAAAWAGIILPLSEDVDEYKIVFFSGDSISTASLRYYKLLGKYELKPIKETNVTILEGTLFVE